MSIKKTPIAEGGIRMKRHEGLIVWFCGVIAVSLYALALLWIVSGDMEPISRKPIHPVSDYVGLQIKEGRVPSAEEIEAVRIRAISVIDSLRESGLY